MDVGLAMVLRCPGLIQEILSMTDWQTQSSAARVCRDFFGMVHKMPLRKLVFGDQDTSSHFGVSRVGRNVVMKLLTSSFCPRMLSITFKGLSGNQPQLTLPTFATNEGQFNVETLIFDGGSAVPLNLSDVGTVFPKLQQLKVPHTSVYVTRNGLSLTAYIQEQLWNIDSGFWQTKAAFELIGTLLGSLSISQKDWLITQYNENSRLKEELLLLLSFLYPATEKESWNVERILQLPFWQQQLCFSRVMEADEDDEFPFEV